MTIQYETMARWGRSFDEYQRMFALTDKDLARRIIGCGDGPASFNADMGSDGTSRRFIRPALSMARR